MISIVEYFSLDASKKIHETESTLENWEHL